MMLSVMVVGAGAAFSDQSKIKNTEAVDACTALNIIGGYPDGSFKPEGNITRAEVTKMICVALNGGKEPNLATNATPTFSDVRTNANSAWAEGYIESCYAQGIVSGVGGGKFAPAGNVTATQMAKMLLVALGYNADNEGFTGNAWATNVNVRASQKGLYEDLENIDVNAALTRDNAAQMIWNALNAYEVEYKTTLVADKNGQLTSQITVQDKVVAGTTDKITLLKDKYESNTATGMMTDAKWNDTTKKYEYTIAFDQSNSATPSEVKSTADYSDLFGMDVKVVYSKDKKSNDTKVYGIVADDSSVIAQGVVGQLKLNSAATDKKIKLDGTSYDLDFAANAIDCYLTNGQKAQSKLSEQMIDSQDAWTVKLLDTDANNKVDRAVLTKVSVQKITYANSTGIRVGSTAYDFDDHNVYKGAAKDDWAIIVDKDYTVDEKAAITKAEVVSGKVQSVKNTTTDQSVRVNGTWYDKAKSYKDSNAIPAISAKVDLVVYGGMYFNTDASTTALDVAVVTGVGTYDKMSETTPVRLMFKDGKEQVVNVEKWDRTEKDVSSFNKDVLVSYDIDDDDYTLTTVTQGGDVGTSDYKGYVDPTTATACSTTYDKDKAAIVKVGTPKNTYYDIAKDAMVVIKNSDDKYVYMTGEQLLSRNDLTFTNVYAAIDENEIGALFATTGSSVTTGDKLYGYITEINTQLNGEDKQKVYIDVIINGEKKENVETDKKAVGSFKVGDVISYTMDGDVMCITEESNVNTRAAIKEFNASRVLFYDNVSAGTTTRKLLTKDTVIIAIDSDDKDNVVYAGNALVAANAKTFNNGVASAYYNNALYYANSDDEIEVIIVQVDDATEFVAPTV